MIRPQKVEEATIPGRRQSFNGAYVGLGSRRIIASCKPFLLRFKTQTQGRGGPQINTTCKFLTPVPVIIFNFSLSLSVSLVHLIYAIKCWTADAMASSIEEGPQGGDQIIAESAENAFPNHWQNELKRLPVGRS